jgi:hypothetical protein
LDSSLISKQKRENKEMMFLFFYEEYGNDVKIKESGEFDSKCI